jgi:hypothetical protein
MTGFVVCWLSLGNFVTRLPEENRRDFGGPAGSDRAFCFRLNAYVDLERQCFRAVMLSYSSGHHSICQSCAREAVGKNIEKIETMMLIELPFILGSGRWVSVKRLPVLPLSKEARTRNVV